MSRSTYYVVIVVTILLGLLFSRPSQCQTYYCTGDVDGDGNPLQPADQQYLIAFVNFTGPPPIPIYQGDLDGDCVVDYADIKMFECYFASGISCFPTYPVPTCSDPDTVRGACCDTTGGCSVRSFANCKKGGGSSALHGTPCNGCGPRCVRHPDGLVAWYTLDQGILVKDIAGMHHGYTIYTVGVHQDGMVNEAGSFRWDPAGGIRVKDDPFKHVGDDNFTIDAWIYPEAWDYAYCDQMPGYCHVRPIIDNSAPAHWHYEGG